MPDRLPIRSLTDVVRLALISSLLYLLWCQVAPAYTATLMGPVNWLLEAEKLPATLTQCGQTTVMSWPQVDGTVRHLQIRGDEAAHLNIVAALTLVFAIPGLSFRRRIGWSVAVALALWGTHVAIFYSGAYSAIAGQLGSLSPSILDAVPLEMWAGFSMGRGERLGDAVGMWTTWVSPAVLILVWLLAAPADARRPT